MPEMPTSPADTTPEPPPPPGLIAFIAARRDEILRRARERVRARSGRKGAALENELTEALPSFLDQLSIALARAVAHEAVDHIAITSTATEHGASRFEQGLTVGQVVHDYGDLCQVITGLAVELDAAVSVDEFRTLTLCLDDAIAGAVTAYSQRSESAVRSEGTERLGALAHEMRNLVGAATLSFASIKRGLVPAGGSTGAIHDRTLLRLGTLIDRSLAEVRMDAGMLNLEELPIQEIVEELEVGATLFARTRGMALVVTSTAGGALVRADRQVLSAALSNLLQNAFKFSRPGATVHLRARTEGDRVLIEVEDECGGLPPGKSETLLQPFVQRGTDRSGLGLGLSICLKAVKTISGELGIRDLPGKGCVFTIDLPVMTSSPAPARIT